ncbi:hypothetical protein PLICRDRAFT_178764 [Plicaturopsis crispa FD-325 SS-3]|nr:hypothetical protein PLICRDRAFT_178764 [Plicaturopsis crispa FD-325 SS-3]
MAFAPHSTTVLVTGFTGFVGSHVADQLLKAGYRVRGTTRTASKAAFLHEKFTREYGVGRFEVAEVPDMTASGAFDIATQGVSAVIHVAAILNLSTVLEEVYEPDVQGTLSVLRAAAKTSTVERVIVTSSTTAGAYPRPDVAVAVTEDSWNACSINKYKDLEGPLRAHHIYAYSKTESEKAAWKFVQDEKPGFTLNTILPGHCFGPSLDPTSVTSSAQFALAVLRGTFNEVQFRSIFPSWFVDVRDAALLHVAALTSAPGARIYAVTKPWSWNELLRIVRELRPERTDLPESCPAWATLRDLSNIDNRRGTALLKGMGREDWISLEESVAANITGF